MNHDDILCALIAAVTQSQERSRRDVPNLRPNSHLIGDVPGCDSLVVLELADSLTQSLASVLNGRDIPDGLLLGSRRIRPTLDEIACDIERFIQNPKARRPTRQPAVKNHTNGTGLNGGKSHELTTGKDLLARVNLKPPMEGSKALQIELRQPNQENPHGHDSK